MSDRRCKCCAILVQSASQRYYFPACEYHTSGKMSLLGMPSMRLLSESLEIELVLISTTRFIYCHYFKDRFSIQALFSLLTKQS